MENPNFWIEILKTSGTLGIFAFFFMGILREVLKHYMSSIDKKDTENKQMGEAFISALNSNTTAIHKLSETHLSVLSAMQEMSKGYDRNSVQNREEHGEILHYVRRGN